MTPEVSHVQVEGVTRDVDSNLVEAAKLRQDGCTGVIVLVTFATVGIFSNHLVHSSFRIS